MTARDPRTDPRPGDVEFAERLYRREHPKLFPHSPWERQSRLSDLWECDQQKYVRRAALLRDIISRGPDE